MNWLIFVMKMHCCFLWGSYSILRHYFHV